MATEEKLDQIVAELRAIKVILQGQGSNAAPAQRPAQQPSNGGGSKYAQKQGETIVACRDCGQSIIWRKSRAGKDYPVNPDGAYHSTTCTNPPRR